MVKVEVAEENFYKDVEVGNEGIGLVIFALLLLISLTNVYLATSKRMEVANRLAKHLEKYKKNFDKSYFLYKTTLEKDLQNKFKNIVPNNIGNLSIIYDKLLDETKYLRLYTETIASIIDNRKHFNVDMKAQTNVRVSFDVEIENVELDEQECKKLFEQDIPDKYNKKSKDTYINYNYHKYKESFKYKDFHKLEIAYSLYISMFLNENDIVELEELINKTVEEVNG